MATWQLQKAKTQFSRLIEDALRKGPQIITRHGSEKAVVLSMEDYRSLTASQPNLRDYLLGGPKTDSLEIPRERDTGRDVHL